MIRALVPIAVIAVLLLSSCGKDLEGLPAGFGYTALPTPTDFEVTPGVYAAYLSWDYPGEDLAELREFRIYYYYSLYDMVDLIGTTTDLSYTDTLLIGNVEYCYRVSAVDTNGFEGWRTAARCVTVQNAAP
jgi:hypothetical protein